MQTLVVLLFGHAASVLVAVKVNSFGVPHSNASEANTSFHLARNNEFAELALGLATSSNLTGLLALLTDAVSKNLNSSSSEALGEQLQPVVSALNDTLEPSVLQDQLIAQHTVSGFEALFLHCEELAATAFNHSIHQQRHVVQLRKDHTSCRGLESVLVNASRDCQFMVSSARTVQTYKCQLYSAANSVVSTACFPVGGENAEAFHDRKLQEYEANLADLLQRRGDCDNATAAVATLQTHCDRKESSLREMRSKCNGQQLALDSDICSLNQNMASDCTASQACQNQAIASYNLASNSVRMDEASIRERWRQLQTIRCMVDSLLQRQGVQTAYACRDRSYSVDHLSVNYAGAPPFSPCQALQETPGSQEYMQILYGSLPANVHAEACRSQCCIAAAANATNATNASAAR